MSRRRRASPAVAEKEGLTAAEERLTAAEERLTAAAATCPVCLSVLIRPVTMPCRHTLCSPCFDSTVEQAALSCPLCRTRISVWLRRTRRAGSLVDELLWRRLQSEFPEKVQARLEGREADFSEEDLEPVVPHLSEPGEIRREYERQLEAERDEEQERRSRSERASRELIDRLEQETEEEARRRREQEQRDAELARGVMQQEQLFLSPGRPVSSPGDRARGGSGGRPRPGSSSTPLRGPMDVYIGQLTPRVGGKRPVSPIQPRTASAPAAAAPAASATTPGLDSTPSPTGSGKENSDPAGGPRRASTHSSDSADSIRAELRHFKPIRSAPRTPPKRRPDGVLGAPPLVHAVARFLDRELERPDTLQQVEEVLDAGGGGDSGEGDGRATAGKRPADVSDGRPAKRRAGRLRKRGPTTTVTTEEEVESEERELPVLSPPRPPEQQTQQEPEPELHLELDLDSAELLQQQLEAERLLALELADRKLAEELQRELNTVPPVDRSKGSADAYSLRGATGGQPSTPARHRHRHRPAARRGRDRAQLSIQESLGRSARAGRRASSPEW